MALNEVVFGALMPFERSKKELYATVLMTGGHSGIGLVGAKTLAQRYGCDLILAGRNVERVERGAQQV